MGIAYDSPRQTTDIDLTTALAPEDTVGDRVRDLLDQMLPRAAAALGYADLIVRTQSVKLWPTAGLHDANFPALKLKVASAKRGSRQEAALQNGHASVVVGADISFNEPLLQIQVLELTGGRELHAYALTDLVAEKYRALLQQVPRNRYRRQDVYDLDHLIQHIEIDDALRARVLEALVKKCEARQLRPTRASLDDREVMERAARDWRSMELELGSVPDFEGCFARVVAFYRNLPW